jgi:D-alanyl-D-alanine carboxypeptidase
MKSTLLLASKSSAIPEPYSHGYLYGSSSYTLADAPYPADLIAAARAGTLKPNDDTDQNPSYAFAAGGAISTADDLAIWMRALVGGRFSMPTTSTNGSRAPNRKIQANLTARSMGMGYRRLALGVYFHGGEMPGYNSFMGYDPVNDVTLVIWTSLTVSLDGQPTANTLMLQMLDQIYVVSPLQ